MNQLNLRKYIKLGYFLLTLYIIYVMIALFSHRFIDLHFTIPIVGMVFIAGLLLIVSILEKNKYFLISSIMFLIYFLFDLFARIFNLAENDMMFNQTIDIIFHSFFILTIFIFGLGVSKFLLILEKRKFIHKLAFQSSKSVYIEYDSKTDTFILELTDGFMDKYGMKKSEYIYDRQTFLSYVKESDHEKVEELIYPKSDSEYAEINFKMSQSSNAYIVFLVFASRGLNRSLWVAFDISDVDAMKKQLALTKNQLSELTIASRKVIENTNELICTIDVNGNILQASNRYCEIFDCKRDNIKGVNINTIGKRYHTDQKDWVKEIIDKKFTQRIVEYEKNGEILVISWKNIALADAFGKTRSVMTIGEDITKLTKLQKSLEYQADYNQITRLLNQNGYDKKIKSLSASDDIHSAACFIVDIDDFFNIIDYYGINISNRLLHIIGKQLKTLITDQDVISNHMEDQFTILLINPSKVAIENIIDKLQENIVESIRIDDLQIQIKKRIGYALLPEHTKSLDELMHFASLASYHQNDTTYNQVTKYQYRMKDVLEKNIILSNRLYQAIKEDKIDVHMQFIVDANDQKQVFVESLARWQDEVLGFVCPDEFFEVARKSNLIELLEKHLVKKSLTYFKALKEDQQYANLKLTLNLTPEMFLKNGFAKMLDGFVEKRALNHKDIVIEVSENTFVHNLNVCNQMIQAYKAYGFMIAIDDFGSQYSSLAVLETLAYDIIKIDGSFINNLENQKNLEIVKMISQIGRLSHKIVIAERVETLEASKTLLDIDIIYQQGYYFHKPQKLI